MAELRDIVAGARFNAELGEQGRIVEAYRRCTDNGGTVEDAARIQSRQQFASLGLRAQAIKAHRIEPLENVAVLAVRRQPAMFGDKPLNVLEAGNDPFLQRSQ